MAAETLEAELRALLAETLAVPAQAEALDLLAATLEEAEVEEVLVHPVATPAAVAAQAVTMATMGTIPTTPAQLLRQLQARLLQEAHHHTRARLAPLRAQANALPLSRSPKLTPIQRQR
jgi:hypothetical protein